MILNEIDQEILEKSIIEYLGQYGVESVLSLYKLHRKLSNMLLLSRFPISDIHNFILYMSLDKELASGKTLREVSIEAGEKHGITPRAVYYFYNNYYKQRKEMEKQNPELRYDWHIGEDLKIKSKNSEANS